jgi:hypothetical protein
MQLIAVGRTIGFRRLPVPQSGAKTRFSRWQTTNNDVERPARP